MPTLSSKALHSRRKTVDLFSWSIVFEAPAAVGSHSDGVRHGQDGSGLENGHAGQSLSPKFVMGNGHPESS
jgi:hypothetical protein